MGVIRSARLPSLLTPVALESGREVVTPTVLMEPAPACSMRTEENSIAATYQNNCNLNDGLLASNAWTSYPRIETDLHNFVAYFAQTYAMELSSAWAQSSATPHPAVFVPIYTGPSYVYTAIAPYVDGFWVSPVTVGGSQSVQDLQRIVTATSIAGGKSTPIFVADYSGANPDSPFAGSTASPFPEYSTQSARGAGMVSWWQIISHQLDVNSKYVIVGVEHWSLYDSDSEHTNSLRVTSATTITLRPSGHCDEETVDDGDAITPIRKFLTGGLCDPDSVVVPARAQ